MSKKGDPFAEGFSDAQLMSLTGVSITTKRNMELRGVFVRDLKGFWDAEKCIQNYIEWLKKRHRSGSGIDGEELSDPDAEFRRQKARMERMKADQMEGRLIEVADVARQWERHVHAAKNKFLSLTDKIIAEVGPLLKTEIPLAEVRDPLVHLVAEALGELAKDPEGDEEEEDPLDETEGEGVRLDG